MKADGGKGALRVIGLTGPVAGGKSEAARLLAERGARIVDLDAIGHELLADPQVREEVNRAFSEAADAGDLGELRRRLAGIVFADGTALSRLEHILHGRMCEVVRREVARLRASGESGLAVIAGALVFEMGLEELCDAVVLVDAPLEIRIDRARRSRGWDREEIMRREGRQMPLEAKRLRANRVLDNSGTREQLEAAVAAIWEEWGCQ
ncbi:MAG TPA: dephospho-CoA kinase [Planctomycetota bacterium]|nr:dephospho-CoA kinase [Planctomycetota bacterium]